jgi:thiosulfate dehydrogenase (quinone) large subunit
MNRGTKIVILLLRVALGVLFVYSGISKLMDPDWSAAGFLQSAQTLPRLYDFFASDTNIQWVNFLNQWGQIAIGAALVLGLFVRWAAYAGVLMMVLYYLPGLHFPYVGQHGYLVDEHIIYIFVLLLLAQLRAGQYIGLDRLLRRRE